MKVSHEQSTFPSSSFPPRASSIFSKLAATCYILARSSKPLDPPVTRSTYRRSPGRRNSAPGDNIDPSMREPRGLPPTCQFQTNALIIISRIGSPPPTDGVLSHVVAKPLSFRGSSSSLLPFLLLFHPYFDPDSTTQCLYLDTLVRTPSQDQHDMADACIVCLGDLRTSIVEDPPPEAAATAPADDDGDHGPDAAKHNAASNAKRYLT